MKTLTYDDIDYTIEEGVLGYNGTIFPALRVITRRVVICPSCPKNAIKTTSECFYDYRDLVSKHPMLVEYEQFFDKDTKQFQEVFERCRIFTLFEDNLNLEPNLSSMQYHKIL